MNSLRRVLLAPLILVSLLSTSAFCDDSSQLQAAFYDFEIMPNGDDLEKKTVKGPLKSVIVLLKAGEVEVVIVNNNLGGTKPNTAVLIKSEVSKLLDVPFENVLIFSTHNHSGLQMTTGDTPTYRLKNSYNTLLVRKDAPRPEELATTNYGRAFLENLGRACRKLPGLLEPVTVHWSLGQERRITYNRKGRRADGSTYFMREKDRQQIALDFTGDIDSDAFVVAFKKRDGRPIGFLVQFTGHPVTAYHPEKQVVHGDWPQVASDVLSDEYGGVPVGFLQGCAGDVNSKHMLSGDISLSEHYGRLLGQTFIDAASRLKPSARYGMGLSTDVAAVPFDDLPSIEALEKELQEINDFVIRAEAGDQKTLECVGLNFPRAFSPEFRAHLATKLLPWTEWALEMQQSGRKSPSNMSVPVMVLRVGDVGIAGIAGEPFLGIGRLIKKGSPLPVAIPCGYYDASYGYIPDAANTGDREYMSSFYRYTEDRPPFRKPAGDAIAEKLLFMMTELAN
jgi:hypothetical protein